ncbi:MAG: MFS transporter [Planctomycetota bacterium]
MFRHYQSLPAQVWILCLGSFINRAGSFVLVFLTIYASEKLGFDVAFATTCLGAVGFGSIVGSMAGGQLADHWGRKPVMLTALFGGGALLLLLSTQTDRWLFLLNIASFAMVAEMYRPAASAMIGDLVTTERRPHAFALMYISINLGFAVAPPLGGWIAKYDYSLLFLGDAMTTAIYGGVIFLLVRETVPKSDSDEAESRQVGLIEALGHIRRDPTFLSFCVSTFLLGIVFTQGFSTLPLFMKQAGFSNVELGMLLSINGVMIVVLQLPLTHWLQRFNAMAMLMIGGTLIGIGFGLTAVAVSAAVLALTIVVWTLGEIIQAPLQQSIVTDMAPPKLRARYLGTYTMSFACALTVGAPFGGRLLSEYGPAVLWSVMFGIAAMAIATYSAIFRRVTLRLAMADGED